MHNSKRADISQGWPKDSVWTGPVAACNFCSTNHTFLSQSSFAYGSYTSLDLNSWSRDPTETVCAPTHPCAWAALLARQGKTVVVGRGCINPGHSSQSPAGLCPGTPVTAQAPQVPRSHMGPPALMRAAQNHCGTPIRARREGCLLFEMRSWKPSPNAPDVSGLS